MGLGRDLDGSAVGTIGLLAHLPGDKSSKETPAGRSGPLTSDDRKIRGVQGQLEQLGERVDQAGVSGSRRSQSSSGREVVLGADMDLESRKLGEGCVLSLEGGAESTGLTETGNETLVLLDGFLDTVQPETVGGEVSGGADGGLGVELVLGKGDGEGGVCGEDERGVALAPVLDHGDVDGSGAGCFEDSCHLCCWLVGCGYLVRGGSCEERERGKRKEERRDEREGDDGGRNVIAFLYFCC